MYGCATAEAGELGILESIDLCTWFNGLPIEFSTACPFLYNLYC